MTSLVAQLESLDRQFADVLAASGDVRTSSDAEVMQAALILGRMQRRMDGAIVQIADEVTVRDEPVDRAARLSSRMGCRGAVDLMRRALRTDVPTARRYVSAASAVRRKVSITSGELLPAAFPELSAVLAEGELSLAGFLACTVPLQKAVRIGDADRAAADALLAGFARGRLSDEHETDATEPGPAPSTEELAGLTAHIIARLDPDGAEPKDRSAKRRRYFTIGRERDGCVPVRGELLPEVAAQLQKLFDALMNPKAESAAGGLVQFRPTDDGETDAAPERDAYESGERADGIPPYKASAPPESAADLRTSAQKRHDAFATIVMAAAASGGMPTLGGAAPTLVVEVRAEDYAGRVGRAKIQGAGYDVSFEVADHAACSGLIQRVLFDEKQQIVGISHSGRIFNAHQRRAIALRDRECVIPGCHVRAEWCEIHHVEEWARGGATHTSNGVPLCWHHHRTLDGDTWQIRMRGGRPEIRGPNWWDPYALWRAPHLDYRAVDTALEAERHRESAASGW